ncbi:MAG: serine hydrolase [DPANN group archaeon]|nr:serine hydrolase [DPANN group archaeon]
MSELEQAGEQGKQGISKTQIITIAQSVAIIILIIAFAYVYPKYADYKERELKANNGLLSSKAYFGVGPKSFTIFDFEPLRSSMQEYITKNNLNVSIYVENLRNGANFGINQREGSFPASLNKLPVAILIMQEVEQGKLSLDSEIPINRALIVPDSFEYHADANGIALVKPQLDIYTNNKYLPLRTLLENMILKSDNSAFQILANQVGQDALWKFLNYVDIDPAGSFNYGASSQNSRLLSPKSLANIFSSLYYSTTLEPEDSEYIMSLMTNTTVDMRKVARLPDDVIVAHKFGIYNTGDVQLFSDCGIMYVKQSRILYCITVRGLDGPSEISAAGDFVRAIYEYTASKRIELDVYKNQGYI